MDDINPINTKKLELIEKLENFLETKLTKNLFTKEELNMILLVIFPK